MFYFFVLTLIIKLQLFSEANSQCLVQGGNNTCTFPSGSSCYNVRPVQGQVDYLSGGYPVYTLEISDIHEAYDIDNICSTSLPMGNGSYMYFRSTVYKNSSNIIQRTILTALATPNVYRGEALLNSSACSTCVFNDFIITSLSGCCSGISAYYRCFLSGDCVGKYNNTIFIGLTSRLRPEDVSPECLRAGVNDVNSQGEAFTRTQGVQLTNRLPRRCVTKVGNAYTKGAESVSYQDSVVIPLTSQEKEEFFYFN